VTVTTPVYLLHGLGTYDVIMDPPLEVSTAISLVVMVVIANQTNAQKHALADKSLIVLESVYQVL
jgi:hypothetical protein